MQKSKIALEFVAPSPIFGTQVGVHMSRYHLRYQYHRPTAGEAILGAGDLSLFRSGAEQSRPQETGQPPISNPPVFVISVVVLSDSPEQFVNTT